MIQYPKLNIRSKNELAKRLSDGKSFDVVLRLINYCKSNKDKLWRDHTKQSNPESKKYVRVADKGTFGKLLNLIDKKLLKPHDGLIAPYIFGGFSGRSNIQAAKNLINKSGQRYLLKLDLKSFFEQIDRGRVFALFYYRCGCSKRAANLLADICCVPKGPKGESNNSGTIGRGFPTSSRLATWCIYEFIIELHNFLKAKLKGRDFRIAIYVDDIGIVASRTSEKELELMYEEVKKIAKKHGLKFNHKKKKILLPGSKQEHLGVRLSKNKISFPDSARAKSQRLNAKLKKTLNKIEKKKIKLSLLGLRNYGIQIKKTN